jgi:mRNA interferase RelE/StbE
MWRVEFNEKSKKNLKKLDKKQASRIVEFLETRVSQQANPRTNGKSLAGDLLGLWRYRFGDYRIICKIEDETITILVIEIGLRREIYR